MSSPSLTEKVIKFLKDNPGQLFPASEIAKKIIDIYSEEYKENRENRQKKYSDTGFVQQIGAEISRNRDTIKRKCSEINWRKDDRKDQEFPKKVWLYWYSSKTQINWLDKKIIDRINRSLNRKKQIILTGAPGSGKTHLAQNLAKHLTSETDGLIETIQLHPAYTYEDFIQGLRPIADENGQLSYQMIPGRFLDFCDLARNRTGKSVLIIDEINRANLPSVFGELLYLLEYRNQSIKLAGSDRPFSIPENVYIIGTMNTADRSIALVDHALRRRFAFIELRPDYSILQKWHDRENTGFNPNGLIETLHKINDIIDDKHYEIGISFFLDRNLKDNIADIWELEIYPYLEELFYSDLGKIEQFRWENIEAKIRHDQDFSNG
jgi:5-methylcytosine-specific restriction endonuclease McrBC GTP-binding regulatory subunit McrB